MHALTRRTHRVVGIGALLVATAVVAGTTYTDFLHALAQRESSMQADAMHTTTHYAGLYQIGEAAMQDVGLYSGDSTKANDFTGSFTGKYGVTSLQGFLSDPDAQTQAITEYHNRVWNNYLTNNGTGGAANYIGQTINGIQVTQSGLVAAAHLVGAGNVTKWLNSGGTFMPQDGNGTKLVEYLQKFAGYSISPTAPSFASVQSATPTGGASTIVGVNPGYTYTNAPLSNPGNVANNSPLAALNTVNPSYASAQQGWMASTGYQMSDLRQFVVELCGALLFLWLANVMTKSFAGYLNGQIMGVLMGQTVIRGMLVLMLLVWVLH